MNSSSGWLGRCFDVILRARSFFCLKAGLDLFIEKPLSVKPVEEVAKLAIELAKLQKQHQLVLGVGYMLRYSPAIQVPSFGT